MKLIDNLISGIAESGDIMLLVKYNKQKNCLYCPKCKTYEVWCDGTGTWNIPAGFGFLPGDGKFSVCGHTLKGYVGQCEKCKERVFNWTSKRAFIKYPKHLNEKIATLV